MYIFLNNTQEIGQETGFTKKNPRLELFRQGFQYNDPITYIPSTQFKESNSIQCFKSKLKNHILSTVVNYCILVFVNVFIYVYVCVYIMPYHIFHLSYYLCRHCVFSIIITGHQGRIHA